MPALPALRAPDLPVVGTVPVVKPAAACGGPVAMWATSATTGSPYQRGLITESAEGLSATQAPCPGPSDAVQYADEAAIGRAVAAAVKRTPEDVKQAVSAARWGSVREY